MNELETNSITNEKVLSDIELAQETAKVVFNPEFIPFYPKIKKDHNLSYLETLLYGFIRFYLSSSSDKFYFTNNQLAELFGVKEIIISRSLSKLSSEKIIETSYLLKSNGGKIRFVRLIQKYKSELYKSISPTYTKVYENNNKINKNKINNNKYRVRESFSSFESITDNVVTEIATHLNTSSEVVFKALETSKDWCLANGKTYKDYKAFLRNWVRKDLENGKKFKKKGITYAEITEY